MKTKKYIMYILGMLVIGISACRKLDETLYSSILASNYYSNENEVLSAVLRPYTHTNAWATSSGQIGWWRISELAADQLAWPQKGVDGYDGAKWIRLHYHTWIANDDDVTNPWTLLWTGLGYCTSAIENLSTRSASDMGIEEADRVSYIAEMKMLHAFYYIRIMDLWGNVPWVTSTSVENPATVSRAVIFDSVENEIKANIDAMPEMTSSNVGRLTRAGAYAMLVELYLNAEVWSGTARWADCITACDSLISGNMGGVVGNLTLDSTVLQTYKPSNRTTSQEQIFSIVYNYQTASFNTNFPSDFYHFHQQYIYGGTVNGNNGIIVVPGVYSTFDDADLRKKNWFFVGPMWYYNSTTGEDNADTTQPVEGYREYTGKQLVFVDAIKRYSELSSGASSADSAALTSDMTHGEESSGVRFNKYKLGASDDDNYRSTSWIIYRLTWIYYAKAEALMRLNGNEATDEAVDLINTCRERDFDASVWSAKKYTTSNFTMDSLLAERGREFIFEGYRRQDIIRFGTFLTGTWWDHTATNDANKLLFAIPSTQLALNPNLVQNTGY
ncbi:MAG: RagB/SusD family nutrient uptake outer membrane protein [Chitinophagaceae bacterium]